MARLLTFCLQQERVLQEVDQFRLVPVQLGRPLVPLPRQRSEGRRRAPPDGGCCCNVAADGAAGAPATDDGGLCQTHRRWLGTPPERHPEGPGDLLPGSLVVDPDDTAVFETEEASSRVSDRPLDLDGDGGLVPLRGGIPVPVEAHGDEQLEAAVARIGQGAVADPPCGQDDVLGLDCPREESGIIVLVGFDWNAVPEWFALRVAPPMRWWYGRQIRGAFEERAQAVAAGDWCVMAGKLHDGDCWSMR